MLRAMVMFRSIEFYACAVLLTFPGEDCSPQRLRSLQICNAHVKGQTVIILSECYATSENVLVLTERL